MAEARASDGTSIHYRVSGRGETPLVLVHGWAASLEQWVPATRYLNRSYRVLRLDLRGHGRSAAPAEGYELESLAGDVLAVMDAASLNQAVLVGHSLGASVCAAVAATTSTRASGLVLVDGPLRPSADASSVGASRLFRLVADSPHPDGVISVYRALYAGRERDHAESFIRESLGSTSAVGAREAWRTALIADLASLVSRVQAPTLYLAAESSAVSPVDAAALLPSAQFVTVADSGHFIHLERPRLLASMIGDFANEVSARPHVSRKM